VYDGGDCVQERDAAGSLTKQFIRGTSLGGGIGGILYNEDASEVREFFAYNAIGSTVALANASGTVTSTNDYEAFGSVDEATGTSTNNRLFCTKERSSGIGLDNFGMRYYDPVLGRFLTRDPAGCPDGPNNYLYCNNNPINHIDPLGLSAEQAEKVRNAKEVFDTFRDSVQGLSDWNPINKFAYGIGNQIVDSAVKRTADALDYATDSYAEAAYEGAGSVAAENAPYIGSLERLVTGERINDATGRVEKTSTTQKVVDAISLVADVAAMVPGKGKAVTTLVDKVKGVFGKGAASVGDDVIAAGARAGEKTVADGKITGYTRHGLNQAIGREGTGVKPGVILDAVKNPKQVVQQSGGRIKYVGSNATVVTNAEGKVITTWSHGSEGLRVPAGGN